MNKKGKSNNKLTKGLTIGLVFSPTLLAIAVSATTAVLGANFSGDYKDAIMQQKEIVDLIKSEEVFINYKEKDLAIIDSLHDQKYISDEEHQNAIAYANSDQFAIDVAKEYLSSYYDSYMFAQSQEEGSQQDLESLNFISLVTIPSLLALQFCTAPGLTEALTQKSKTVLGNVMYSNSYDGGANSDEELDDNYQM